MRYLHIRLAGENTTLHPLVPFLTDTDRFRDAKMIDWSPSFDPPRVTVLLYLDGDLDWFEAVLDDTDLVLEYDIICTGESRGYAYVHSKPHPTEWQLFEIATGTGLVPVFPVQYHDDGTLSVRIVGPTDRLKAAVEGTPSGVETSIERVGEYDLGKPPIPPSLSTRQREALKIAFDIGYYEVPREATRRDVADRLNCAPSTASEHLRKAEHHVIETYLNHQ